MSLETKFLDKTPPQSPETSKETFGKKLDAILLRQLTPDNIETFADDALSRTVELTNEVLKEYRNNPELRGDVTPGNQKEEEDEAFEALGLPNLEEVLDSILEVKGKIDALKTYIHENAEYVDTVITPPEPAHGGITNEEFGGKMEEKRIFPRLLTLLYILEHDFEMPPTDVAITRGKVTPEMMRKTPYVRVEVAGLNRVVYICDEEGNASYVFDVKKLEEASITLEEVDIDDKGDKNSLISRYPGIGIRLIHKKHWRSNMAEALGNPLPETEQGVRAEETPTSEFRREKEAPLSFENFRDRVQECYPGEEIEKNVAIWYREEQQSHLDWPSAPHIAYKNKGWEGWPELVGKERKKFLPFPQFTEEVRELYPGKGDIRKWYIGEKKKHHNWPYYPEKVYKDAGWQSWLGFFGIDDRRKKNFLPFPQFTEEVRELYPGKGDVQNWYNKEREEHPGWPSHPKEQYEEDGWQGWPELFGKERKEFLPFPQFTEEVRELYPGKGSVLRWYRIERKEHLDWPSLPEGHYKEKGWQGWPDLVGKK